MHNIHIAGTGTWHPKDKITNEEIQRTANDKKLKENIQEI